MTLIDIEPAPTQPEGRRRWPIIAVAAAAVVAIVVGAVMLAARDDSAPQVPADTTVAPDVPDAATAAEEIARGFLDAYAANDADQAITYLDRECHRRIVGVGGGVPRGYRLERGDGIQDDGQRLRTTRR